METTSGTTDVLIGRVLERLDSQDRSSSKFELDIKSSLKEIVDQTKITNGRVTAIEKQNTGWANQLALIKWIIGFTGIFVAGVGFFFGASLQHIPFLDGELKSIHSDIDALKNPPEEPAAIPAPSPTPHIPLKRNAK